MEITDLKQLLDTLWVLIAAILMFVMQAGFICLEAGLTRQKNNINVAAKNLATLGVVVALFWLFGYGIIFGQTGAGLIGLSDFSPDFHFAKQSQAGLPSLAAFFFFQVMFCCTAVTIISGATAERMRFGNYLIVTAVVSIFIYPIVAHWVWNGLNVSQATGWLGRRGFVDFAGTTVIHSVGGWASLAALLILGPRLGRFNEDGEAQALPKANLPLATLGTIILWFGWFGFNGGSLLFFDTEVALVITNTLLAGAAGLVAVIFMQIIIGEGIVEADYLINGALAGLVAITASANAVTSRDAFLIGIIGTLSMLAVDSLLLRFQIDDAVGAIPVHLGAGLWGTLAVAIFADPAILNTGLTRWEQLGIQTIGIIVTCGWAFFLTLTILNTIDRFLPLRVTGQEEELGLNISEHNALADNSEFMFLQEMLALERVASSEQDQLLLPE